MPSRARVLRLGRRAVGSLSREVAMHDLRRCLIELRGQQIEQGCGCRLLI